MPLLSRDARAEQSVLLLPEEEGSAGGAGAYVPYEYFPPIRRNLRPPDFDSLPQVIVDAVFGGRANLHMEVRPQVSIRVFVFYGAGDIWYAWAELASKAPPYCEVAVHEWPSHGGAETSRGEEDPCESLDALAEDALRAVRESLEQHTSGGRIAMPPFVLIGHSIGCLLVTALAQKLRERMGLEPAAVVMLDGGPPHLPLHSEYGQRYRDESPWDFMRDYNLPVWKAASDASKKSPEKGEGMLSMWLSACRYANDTRPVGSHTFQCDLVVLRAMQNFRGAWLREGASEEERFFHETRDKVMGSPPGCSADFSPEQFEEWEQWAEPGRFMLRDVDTSHMGIKANPAALQIIWYLLLTKRAPDPTAKRA